MKLRQHRLKTWPTYWVAVHMGLKTFEIRKNDRDFRVGDILLLREYVPIENWYTGNTLRKAISYKLENHDGITEGYCILGLRDLTEEEWAAMETGNFANCDAGPLAQVTK